MPEGKISDNLNFYRERLSYLYSQIKSSAEAAGRDPADIALIAASKYAGPKQIKELLSLGHQDFGENRAEELVEKYQAVGGNARWHFIGHLQSRKVKMAVAIAEYIHSVDSAGLLEKINSEAAKISKIQKVLIEINVSAEPSKYGISPLELKELLAKSKACENICICGFMTMAPLTDNQEVIRKTFSGLKKILDDVRNAGGFEQAKELSMGMSNDFPIAVKEGATMLRIGSLIFL
ncbi:MAG: YggS family pyridoxal phosphate-dependent enzyme [Actinobacteria bacterium]|nr:YggS family pyridoxal phosphate-dependent enzyme [Actinomycetota bacterium]